MSDAPPKRSTKDLMKYRYKLISVECGLYTNLYIFIYSFFSFVVQKKVSSMKKCAEDIYPFYTQLMDFWVVTLKFVQDYIYGYYNDTPTDNSLIMEDEELNSFYIAILKHCGIDKKYSLKKVNIISMLAHFIVNATLWNNHLSTSISFEYLIDPTMNGLKINHFASSIMI